MDVLLLLNLLCTVFLLTELSDANNCTGSSKCSPFSPKIQFPFRIKGLQPHNCGLPFFDLFCNENRTMIHFPKYGNLAVKSISYDTRRLSLVDPKNCVHEVFLNLNLSHTPFNYFYVLKEYKYINCSDKLVGSFQQVPCLSSSNYHIYVVESSFSLPVTCSCVRTVAIPFSYSPYLSDNSFGLRLTWDSVDEATKSGCKPEIECEIGRWKNYLEVSGMIMAFGFMVGWISYATLYKYREELNEDKVKKTFCEVETDKLLGDTGETTA